MTATRSTKEEHSYKLHRRRETGSRCVFCAISKNDKQYVEETTYFKVIRNLFPYSIWDGQGVHDHLMIIPKAHTDKLGNMNEKAAIEYLQIIDRYESEGYNLYARAPASTVKSVVHQHTHLILLDGKERRFVFLLRKPFYIRLSRT